MRKAIRICSQHPQGHAALHPFLHRGKRTRFIQNYLFKEIETINTLFHFIYIFHLHIYFIYLFHLFHFIQLPSLLIVASCRPICVVSPSTAPKPLLRLLRAVIHLPPHVHHGEQTQPKINPQLKMLKGIGIIIDCSIEPEPYLWIITILSNQ